MRLLLNYLQFAKIALTIAAVVALGVFLWPGALPAVVGFTFFGLSIAAVVGSNILLQVGAVAALTFVGLHALGITIDLVGGVFSLFKSCCCSPRSENEHPHSHQEATNHHATSHQKMNHEMPPKQDPKSTIHTKPEKHSSLYSQTEPPQYDGYPEGYTPIYPQLH
jgi:hypothetical protein